MLQNQYEKMMNRLYEGKEITENQYREMRKAFFFGYIDCFAYLTENITIHEDEKALEMITRLREEIETILSNTFDWDRIEHD